MSAAKGTAGPKETIEDIIGYVEAAKADLQKMIAAFVIVDGDTMGCAQGVYTERFSQAASNLAATLDTVQDAIALHDDEDDDEDPNAPPPGARAEAATQ